MISLALAALLARITHAIERWRERRAERRARTLRSARQ